MIYPRTPAQNTKYTWGHKKTNADSRQKTCQQRELGKNEETIPGKELPAYKKSTRKPSHQTKWKNGEIINKKRIFPSSFMGLTALLWINTL